MHNVWVPAAPYCVKGTLVKVGPVSQLHNVPESNIVLCGLYLRIHGASMNESSSVCVTLQGDYREGEPVNE